MNAASEPLWNDASVPNQPPGREPSLRQPQASTTAKAGEAGGLATPSRQQIPPPDAFRPTPGSNITRIYGISDCVIAVAFTLFVVNIRLPPPGLNESGLRGFVASDMLVDDALYVGVYVVVASSWISHYRILTYMRQSNVLFVLLNVVFLGSIVFLPVPVALFYRYIGQAGVWQVFAGTQLVTSTTLLLMWIVARADRLLDTETPAAYVRYLTARLLMISCGTLLSFGVAFVSTVVAEGIFLFQFLLAGLLRARSYRHHRREDYLPGTTRMCSITDNMVAVAITFLIATITSAGASNSQQPFAQTLTAIWTALPLYGITFLIVGFYWLSHHRLFMLIRRHNMALIWLNFAFLLFIELQPQFNALHATYPSSPLTKFLYAVNQALCGLMLVVIWVYAAQKHRLIDETMNRAQSVAIAWRALVPPLFFLLSIAVVFFRSGYAVPLWLLVIGVEVARAIAGPVRRGIYQARRVISSAERKV